MGAPTLAGRSQPVPVYWPRMRFRILLGGAVALLLACGGGATPARVTSVRQALTTFPEVLEFESTATRQELFREAARASLAEAGQAANPAVLFPFSDGEALIAAPGFDPHADLLAAPDAGHFDLAFGGRSEIWPEDRRDALQGLSEREVAELVAHTLLARWGVHPDETITVERATGAPYAVAYVDGILRINPSFLYLAAALGAPSSPAASQ